MNNTNIKFLNSLILLLVLVLSASTVFSQGDNYNVVGDSEELIYIFTDNGLTDDYVKAICEKEDPYITYELYYEIFSNSEHFSNAFNFDKIYFCKSSLTNISLNFISPDWYNDYVYFSNSFHLEVHEEILTVFRYHLGVYDCKDILVIISTDGADYYLTEMFAESCGNHGCGPYRLSINSAFYYNYFKNVSSKAEFEKVFPKYMQTPEFKEKHFAIYESLD